MTLDQPNEPARTMRRKTRRRRPLPSPETRDWLTPYETALALGCSVATVHQLRRGLIPAVEPLPSCQYGRKIVFRKPTIARWRERNETSQIDEKQARIRLDDMVAVLNRNPAHVLGAEPVRRFLQQVYIPQKYEDGDWRKAAGQEAENLFNLSDPCCR
jgi:hypothetical protein